MELGSPEFLAAVAADVATQGPSRVILDVDWRMAICLVGQLQLALRHPQNRGAAAANTRAFTERLIQDLSVTEPIRRLLEGGWDPAHDVARPPPGAGG